MRVTAPKRATIDNAQRDAVIAAKAEKLQDTLATLRAQLADRPVPPKVAPIPAVSSQVTIPTNPNRPKSLDEIVGQNEVTMMLRLSLAGAQLRGEPLGHVLVSGAPGLGKSSIASIVASEMGVPMISTTGMLLKKSTDIIGLLMSVDGPAVLFVDEAHLIAQSAMTVLYQVAEDGAVDMLAGSGPDTHATTKQLPGLVIVAATTHPGKLSQSFRDRLNIQLVMDEYSDEEIAEIVQRFWKAHNARFFKGEDLELARRSRGIPRKAISLAGHCLDYMMVNQQPAITTGTVNAACAVYGVDSSGLDNTDRRILEALTGPFSAKATGIDNLAAYLDMEPSTIADAHEGYLVRRGLVVRTGRGRLATAAAYELMKGAA